MQLIDTTSREMWFLCISDIGKPVSESDMVNIILCVLCKLWKKKGSKYKKH